MWLRCTGTCRRAYLRQLAAFLAAVGGVLQSAALATSPAGVDFFEKQIRPVLTAHCYPCHSGQAKALKGDLLLDSRSGWQRGGESGPVIVPGAPDQSLLLQAIRHEGLEMPPDGKLADKQIADFETWIEMGAPDPRQGNTDAGVVRSVYDWEASKQFWSLRPLQDPPPPHVDDPEWSINPVDRFVFAKLSEHDFDPAGIADRRTLMRRVTFDLTGLPPEPDDIRAFVSDTAADAFNKVVDRLLASPHYGQRWGRHWLDVVRYADTSGCNGDFPIPDAYRYRNYVIDSFNADKPYDQFLREQIAGDLLPADTDAQRFEQIVATGYLAISRRFSSLAEEFHLTIDDTIDNLGRAILGLSISCARCHDHKFDPIPQQDYYALYGIFDSTKYAFPGTEIYRHTQNLTPLLSSGVLNRDVQPLLDQMVELDAKIFEVYSYMASLDTGPQKDAERKRWQELQKKRDALVKQRPACDWAYGASEGDGHDARLHRKGDPEKLGPVVPRAFLQVLGAARVADGDLGSGRRQLGEWLTDPENPLTARVLVNRIWLHHFAQGIVTSPDDFGTRGSRPSHPELLDYLASRLIQWGWSTKRLHRLILLSRTYRQVCEDREEYLMRDPENRWLWKFNRRRLEAEEIRDTMLSISGELDRSTGGPHPFKPEWEWKYTQHKPFVDDFPTRRRSVYLMQQRIRQQPYLAVFDGADTNVVTGLRQTSTTPLQALFLLNNEFAHRQAAEFARRVQAERHETDDRIRWAFELALGRTANAEEVREGREFIRSCALGLAKTGIDEDACQHAAWSSYLRVLMGTNEFVFVE